MRSFQKEPGTPHDDGRDKILQAIRCFYVITLELASGFFAGIPNQHAPSAQAESFSGNAIEFASEPSEWHSELCSQGRFIHQELPSLTLNEVLSLLKKEFKKINFLRIQKCIQIVIFLEKKIPNSQMIFKHEFVATLEQGGWVG